VEGGGAERTLGARGDKAGLDAERGAAGIDRVINARMADQIRLGTVKRGYDPRQFSLVVLGGAGAVQGAAFAAERWPGRGRAALAADLPALRPAEIGAALAAAGEWAAAFVPDAAGSGTTLYAAGPAGDFRPAYGPGSAGRHAAGGAAELDLPGIDGLRRDVDTAEDLGRAAALGLGARTAAVAASLGGYRQGLRGRP